MVTVTVTVVALDGDGDGESDRTDRAKPWAQYRGTSIGGPGQTVQCRQLSGGGGGDGDSHGDGESDKMVKVMTVRATEPDGAKP